MAVKGGTAMDQQKTVAFLKQLRKEKGLTQEALAERFHVSSKTVSRWETGINLPDVETLLALAAFYDVDIRELIDGERKNEQVTHETTDTLKLVAAYAATEQKKAKSKLAHYALGICGLLLICTVLFVGETKGLLYGIVPTDICHSVLFTVYVLAAALAVSYLKVHWFLEKPSPEPEKTTRATVVSKAIKPGTHFAGRSKGGYSYVVCFRTEDNQQLELFAYEIEFGGLKKGMQGLLTYQGPYFVSFQKDR